MQGGLGALLFSKEDLRKLLVPLMLEQLLAVTIGMMDTMMVANCGEAAVSGISLVDSINVLLIQLFSAMATGGAIVAAQYLGRKDTENACKAAAKGNDRRVKYAVGALVAVAADNRIA